jgi:regulator of replication initiation timing
MHLYIHQVEFSEERYKMLQSNVQGFKKEAVAASEKSHQLNLSNTKLQLQLDSQSEVSIDEFLSFTISGSQTVRTGAHS